jgi:hypothetical protein
MSVKIQRNTGYHYKTILVEGREHFVINLPQEIQLIIETQRDFQDWKTTGVTIQIILKDGKLSMDKLDKDHTLVSIGCSKQP